MRLAQKTQEDLLRRVANNYKEKSPGFVITHANELTSEKMAEIRQSLFDKFEINDENQIILSDTDIKNVPQEVERLIKTNSHYTQASLNLHQEKLMQLSVFLSEELTALREQLEIKEIHSLRTRRELRTIQRSFETAQENYIGKIG